MSLPVLPGKESFLIKMWNSFEKAYTYTFRSQVYAAKLMAQTQKENTVKAIEYQKKRDEINQELQKAQIITHSLQAQANIDLQKQEGELNRELQTSLARIAQETIIENTKIDRDLRLKIAQLNEEFQREEGKLNREHAEKLESLRSQLQKWALDEQKKLQLKLKEIDGQLARELRLFDRQTSLEVIKEQKREQNSPLVFVTEDLIETNPDEVRLLVLFSPPKIKQDNQSQSLATQNFPDIEHSLSSHLRDFFHQYISRNRQIEFLPGAWTSKAFHSESATKALFRSLKTEPTLILEDLIEGNDLFLNMAFWGMNFSQYRYQTALKLSWLETLFDIVKVRTLDWLEKRQAYEKSGKDPEQFDRMLGHKAIEGLRNNLSIIELEQECIAHDYDPTEIDRPYSINDKDYKALTKFISNCHCLFAGILIDEFFLLHVAPRHRQRPLLPELIPELIQDIPEKQQKQLQEIIVSSYQAMYQALGLEESAWLPELTLDLADSFSYLEDKSPAIATIENSIKAWLTLRGVNSQGEVLVLLDLMKPLVTSNDTIYIQGLKKIWQVVGTSLPNYELFSDKLSELEFLSKQEEEAEKINEEKRKQEIERQKWEEEKRRREILAQRKQQEEEKKKLRLRNDLGDGIILELAEIPGGSYLMGNEVKINLKGFLMSKYPITQAQWRVIMGNNPSYFKGDSRPVETVSWIEANDFCHKLSQLTGRAYRLPTEAEWEYACRAGTDTKYFWGDRTEELNKYAWYCDNSGRGSHPVGLKQPNAWGLYDMLGNVWEWCADSYENNLSKYPSNGTAYTIGTAKSLRGGSWSSFDSGCNPYYRYYLESNHRDLSYGFRVVCPE